MATMTHRGRANFIVTGKASTLNWTPRPANGIGNYAGTIVIGGYDRSGPTIRLHITPDRPWTISPWTISVASVPAPPTDGTQNVSGKGDAIFNCIGNAGTARPGHNWTGKLILSMTRIDGSWSAAMG